MRDRCFSPDEIETIPRLPSDSPERRHLEACPRCRALLLTYREFVEDLTAPDAADLQDAGERLRAAFRESMARTAGPTVRSRGLKVPRWIRHLPRRIGRASVLVPAAAAILVVVGLYAGIEYLREATGPDSLRGPSPSERGAFEGAILLLDPRPIAVNGIELRWRSLPDVSSYEVVLFAADLKDLARLGPLSDTTCIVRRGDLLPEPPPGTVVGWQVVGLRDGAAVARSSIGTARTR